MRRRPALRPGGLHATALVLLLLVRPAAVAARGVTTEPSRIPMVDKVYPAGLFNWASGASCSPGKYQSDSCVFMCLTNAVYLSVSSISCIIKSNRHFYCYLVRRTPCLKVACTLLAAPCSFAAAAEAQ